MQPNVVLNADSVRRARVRALAAGWLVALGGTRVG